MQNPAVTWARHNAVALVALFVALGGTAYAAGTINGKEIQNGTIAGKKLKKDGVGGKQVKESTLGTVPSATRSASAGTADTAKSAATATDAANATNAVSAKSALAAQTAATLGAFGPEAFARASQIEVRGPFETDPLTGTDQDFFHFPGIDFTIRTPRAPNAPGSAGLVQLVHPDLGKRMILHIRTPSYEVAREFQEGGESGINWPVNHTGAEEEEDFIELTAFSLETGLVVRIECVADDSVAGVPVTCVAIKSKP